MPEMNSAITMEGAKLPCRFPASSSMYGMRISLSVPVPEEIERLLVSAGQSHPNPSSVSGPASGRHVKIPVLQCNTRHEK